MALNTFVVSDITCSNMNNGIIDINCTGGTGAISYTLLPVNLNNLNGLFNNLPAAIYTVVATDANGCTYTTSALISNPQPLIIDSLSSTNVLCSGGTTGGLSISASGGTGNLNYNLMPSNINNANGQFLNLAANSYTITITDANQCSITTSIIITEPLPLTAAVLNLQNVLCSGGISGQIEVGANGGTSPYLFTILPLNVNNGTGIFGNLTAGTYTVNVSDSNQCTASIQPIVITEPNAIKFDQITKQDILCYGDSTGNISVVASGGTGNIGFAISPLAGLQNPAGQFSALTAGTYTIIATDANNCTLSTIVTLTQNAAILITDVTMISPKCWGEANGIIQVTGSGGIGLLTYLLDNANANNNGFFGQQTGGNHLITVTDALGCRVDSAIILAQPSRLQFGQLQIDPVFCKGYSDGKIISSATGGNGGYTYYLRPGLQVNKTGNFINLHEGIYTLSIRDSAGCEYDTIIAVSPPLSPMQVYISKKDLNCYGNGKEGWALANMVGGNAPFTYLWSTTPAQFDAKATNLFFGYYYLEVTDAKGCKAKDSVYIESGPCCEEVFIPNAFSPNGDGNNDVFRITSSAGIELIQFDIYDRWGKRVWSTNDFRGSWDGMDKGQDCDVNTYYYVFRYRCLTDGENYIKKGDVNLIR
ncbi:MAG: gliding motility-associated C-terminal domain-containing protein [Chitinophagaceae bacterium]|nr:gliding motility-associated C-terminal domain-containing protein [Chitinophagaceae bacterium]